MLSLKCWSMVHKKYLWHRRSKTIVIVIHVTCWGVPPCGGRVSPHQGAGHHCNVLLRQRCWCSKHWVSAIFLSLKNPRLLHRASETLIIVENRRKYDICDTILSILIKPYIFWNFVNRFILKRIFEKSDDDKSLRNYQKWTNQDQYFL